MKNLKICFHVYSSGEIVFWLERDGLFIPLLPVVGAARIFKPAFAWEDQLLLAERALGRLSLREPCVQSGAIPLREECTKQGTLDLYGSVLEIPPALLLEVETKRLWETLFYDLEEAQLLAVRHRALRYLNDGAMLPVLVIE